ncbi:hypothetical protein TanjilG_14645 [Lupinus angustifolius]|uniref:Lipoxygenase n=1 Tax=Lupinus angustifolius TaxID=3871 RepID=A0A1J7IAH3_LUPAN|nr:hypothetical protein TanjilG_14645 [Lupinus angustifolius]
MVTNSKDLGKHFIGGGKGKVGKQAFLEKRLPSLPNLGAKQDAYTIHFEWDNDFGIPGAFYIKNFTQSEFFLVNLTLEDIPNQGTIHFLCNSWVYNSKLYETNGIFFANKTYLPSITPPPLVYYREEELKTLRGNGKGERKEWERIYDYDVYNDLDNLDKNASLACPILGGSTLPYLRRGRTSRKSSNKGGIKLPTNVLNLIPNPFFRELVRTYGEHVLKFPEPKVIQGYCRKQVVHSIIPYLRKINATDTRKAYATRTILFLQSNGNLNPLAIELSKPHPQGDNFGPISNVYLPTDQGVDGSLWLLAKAYLIVNDSCFHQLVCHWLNTHAVVEPFIIAANIHLKGIIESTFLLGKYSMENSAVIYKDWVFLDQAPPADLIKR